MDLTGVAQWVGHYLVNGKVAVSILVMAPAWIASQVPQLGVRERQPIDVSLPLFLPPFPSL